MFAKVLIANRGEIAVRIIRACRELGIHTVAVFSDADRQALHVRFADEACRQAELAFIGPNPSSIAAMGDKAIARATVARAGVPVVPGTEGEGALSDDELLTLAPRIGFPLLIKATAGGGGKGMREVHSLEGMPDQLQSARREAEAAFGDGNVYLEKLVEGARHIEIQVLADEQGNVIHLGERECSIQRRHQKLLEESPSPFVAGDEQFRQILGTVAVRAAQAVHYVNAGTIEFLVDKDKNYYFLEMNTRLQVEHPVTEMVTGVDIVKEQLRIACGHLLSHKQADIHPHGWAIECRINAEDPYNNFIPSTGRITHTLLPTGPGIRVDTGVYIGFDVSPYYDSLISKLIVWGATRGEAIQRMSGALQEYKILGLRSNIPFHQQLMASPSFLDGAYDTRFIEERFSQEVVGESRLGKPAIAALLATLVAHQQTERTAHIIMRNTRDTSNWKWLSRWERMHR
jgi:acetyl-CoA carboxylase biotin carboxylase subunit